MPLFNTATTASALGVTPKWLDNLLSHNNLAGLPQESQGVARRLSISVITQLALAKELIDQLGVPSPAALAIAARALQEPPGECYLSPHLRLSLDIASLKSQVLDRLTHAVETAPTPRRGRPPKR